MIYTRKQRELMAMWQQNKLKRINLLEGSVSSGKTWISLVLWAFWVKTMPDGEDCLYLMAARSLTTLKRNCLLLLQSLVGESNFRFSMSTKEGRLFGRHIILEGADDSRAEAKIRGLTLQGAYVDEATKVPRDFWTMLLSRLRKPGAKLFATTNPDAPGHWLKAEYIDRKAELSMLVIKFLLDDNTTLPKDYVDNLKTEYTGLFYERFILGEWTLAEGLIYPMFEQALGEPPEGIQPTDAVLSVDYGTKNPLSAGLWRKYGDAWYRTAEYYYDGRAKNVQKTDADYGNDLEVFLKKHGINERIRTIVDPSAASFITELRKYHGNTFRVMKADNDVSDGIRETATAMQRGIIKITKNCKDLKRELQGYVWDEGYVNESPVKVDDHACDDMRYFVKTMRLVMPRSEYQSIYTRKQR